MGIWVCGQALGVENVWTTDKPLPGYKTVPVLRKVEHRRIHTAGTDYKFLLGVSIAEHKGLLWAAWLSSGKSENDAKSISAYSTSRDGEKWSSMKPVALNPPGPDAHSHGVLLSSSGSLWAFAPRAEYEDSTIYPNLRMEVFRWDETIEKWVSKGETAPGFWPLCEPQKMDDGNWMLAGAVPHKWPSCDAAVAISAGDDLTKWTVVVIPSKKTTWGETSVVIDGPRIRAFVRPPKSGDPLLTSRSKDYGRTWSNLTESNLPVSDSKIYAGRLHSGAYYLIMNISQRNEIASKCPALHGT